jgi:hypothetical protein
MKRILIAAATVLPAVMTPAFATDVGVSVTIGQPGFYGRIDIGGYPPPAVIYSEPVIIERVPVARPPVYLRVPPGQAKKWGSYCHHYNACGERVYFVTDEWYSRDYVPAYQKRHGNPHGDKHWDDHPGQGGQGQGQGSGKGHGKGKDKD